MDFGRKIICPMDGYTEKTVYMVELTDDNGKKTGYLSNGCDDANGGEVCERVVTHNQTFEYARAFPGETTRPGRGAGCRELKG